MRYETNRHWQANAFEEPKGPHGGRLETMARAGFGLAVFLIIGLALVSRVELGQVPTEAGDRRAVKNADVLANAFLAKGDAWTNEDLVAVRNGLIAIIDGQGQIGDAAANYVRSRIEITVGNTLKQLNRAVSEARDTDTRIKTYGRWQQATGLLTANPATAPLIYNPHLLRGLGMLLLKGYLLFMPFAFICFVARLYRLKYSFVGELVYGFTRVVSSLAFWPVGMACYPKSPALALRRARIAIDYMARKGIDWRTITSQDEAAIDMLARSRGKELRDRLDAICQMPWHLLFKAKLGLCSAAFVGFLFSALTFGRGTAHAAENAPVTNIAVQVTPPQTQETPKPLAISGYAQVSADLTNGNTKAERLIFRGNGSFDGLDVTLMGNLAPKNPALYVMQALKRLGPISVGAGQIVYQSAYQVPAPDGQRIIGGPICQSLLPFWGLGAEVLGDHGVVKWGVTYMSETDLSMPGVRKPRSAQAALSFPKLGRGSFLASATVGKDGVGMHASYSAKANVSIGPVGVSGNGVINYDAGAYSKGVSGFIGWLFSPYLYIAGQYDRLDVPNTPLNQRFGLQATVLGWADRVQVGVLGFKSSVIGPGWLMRLQFAF